MRSKITAVLASGALAVAVTACGPGGQDTIDCDNLPDGKLMQECVDKEAVKAEAINYQNDPRNFGVELETIVTALPSEGRAERPAWPGDYWATVNDSVNHRWQGRDTLSPLEKYDMAFNDWTPPEGFMDLKPFSGCGDTDWDQEYYNQLGPAASYWSNNKGNKAQRDQADDRAACDEAIEGWWGLCHAWVPAAILEDEPEGPVEYNGVTFEVSDMKALFLMMYDRSSTKFLGTRCNLRDDEIERDEHGRIKQSECRDTNPGSLHLILTNFLGRSGRAFAEDRTMNYQVWNQPVVGYRFRLVEEIDEEQATRLLTPDCEDCSYSYNDDAERFFEVLADVDYITESHASTEPMIPRIDRYTRTDTYHYILECDQQGTIIGGEWISAHVTAYPDRISFPPDSQDVHADFLWLPLRAGRSSNPYASLENVRMLVRMSKAEQPPPAGDARVYKSQASVTIPDNDSAGAVSAIEVPDDLPIQGVKVRVNISHTYVSDLTIRLRHDGTERTLQANAGGSSHDLQKTFEVEGFSGSAMGNWELVAIDGAARDTGDINEWELTVYTGSGGGGGEQGEVYRSGTAVAIPDDDENGVESSITVPGSGAIRSLKVDLDISHTWISDLRVELRHGAGVATLHNRAGNDADDIKKTFTVDEFDGADAGGTWTLRVSDSARADTGMLNSWSVEIVR